MAVNTDDFRDTSHKVSDYSTHIHEDIYESVNHNYVYHDGHVATDYGYVKVYADASRRPSTSLVFIWRGRIYERQWQRYFRPRYIITLAKRFAADVVQQEDNTNER